MTDFVVTITDPTHLAGITWAREQYNATLPPPPPEPPDTVTGGMAMAPMATDAPPPLETDEDYVQMVMEQAAISYADQQLRQQYRDAYESEAGARRGA